MSRRVPCACGRKTGLTGGVCCYCVRASRRVVRDALHVSLVRLAIVRDAPPDNMPRTIDGAEQAVRLWEAVLGSRDLDREHFVAVFLDARHNVNGVHVVSVGSLSASIVHPREVFKGALLANAGGLVVMHNHPSGDPEPSPEDVAVTRRLRQAGELLGVDVLDHIVVTPRSFVSLKARGCL